MLTIKLKPIGKKKQISYRIVVSQKGSKLKGKFIEDLGWYNPHTNKFLVAKEKVKKWIDNGAQPSGSIHNILISAGAIEGVKIPMHKKSKKPIEQASVVVPENQSAEPVQETIPAEQPVENSIPEQNQESSEQVSV
ncbi:MAG: 30S ribosomal protein S16 [Candidatus Paceibacterota bacterium]|jgi:small subunit ribosomal protein S16